MKKIVKQLIDLQEIDSRFDILQLQKGDLPLMIDESESELQTKTKERKELDISIEKGEADRRMFQMEIEASNEKLKQYEEQLYKVQTNKEYDAISLEIDTKKMEIKELENKILQSIYGISLVPHPQKEPIANPPINNDVLKNFLVELFIFSNSMLSSLNIL